MMNEAVITLDHVSASEGNQVRVDDLNLTVQRGEAVALVGSHASGKGLTLRLCAGLEAPESGSVRILGVNPAAASEELLDLRQRVGFVFAKPALINSLSVFDNVALPLRYHDTLPEAAIQDRVMTRLVECGVEDLRDRFPAGLAMGDARLVALARAMAMDAEILFVDEVLFGWDADELVRFRKIVEHYRKQRTLTIIVTFSAPTGLFAMMDRLVLIRDGRVIADCPPVEASRVDDPMVRDFVIM
ncbi:MAG TPA: ATP-binding cassette domain-containing protein [Nitrospirales bacterium]|jgi:phospholipid/cholesterol/gamma-HCH transport system ATP-binding protein|nr:ATP-binding cassette domain-containing protein [Nitrospirales bacterium]